MALIMFGLWIRLSIIILLANLIQSYKILYLPIAGKSHVFAATAICEELARRGHSVTMLLPDYFPVSNELETNQSGIHVERILHAEGEIIEDYEKRSDDLAQMALEGNQDLNKMIENLSRIFQKEYQTLLTDNDKLFAKLKDDKFDLAVVENILMTKYLYLVPHRLSIPFATYTDVLPPIPSGVPSLPSFVPHQFTTYTDKMTFGERLQNTAISLFMAFERLFPDPPDEILNKYREYGEFSNLDDLSRKSLLWLTTRDISLDYPKPSMPNVINIGGLTTKPATGELTAKLDGFISSAKKGAILCTFGSQVDILKSSIAKKFISAFQSLPDYRIIWKFKNMDNLTIPDNVQLAQWLPQNDLLADGRVKLFITHSGNNGQHEAIYHGVPMIAFPLFGEQPYNAARLPARGYGIVMNFHDFTSDQLLSNILKIVIDPTYKERTTRASKIFKSALQTPAERASYWIEHVIQFGGDHLRSAGLDLNFVQYYMLDILAFVIVVITVVVTVMVMLVARLVRCCTKNSGHQKKKQV